MSELKRGEAKRLALLQATAGLIMEKGIAAVTTREVAERAGSTERTLFKQFGSKEGLLTEVLDHVARMQLAQSGFASLSDPPRTLDAFELWHRQMLEERASATLPRTEVGRLFLLEILQNDAFKARYGESWLEALWRPLVACLDGLKAAGEVDDAQPTPLLAQSFLSLNLGYLVARLNVAPDYAWDTERDVAGIAGFFRRAIAPKR
ncbi:MAG TPA: helix-turn-helix domain-containing protein [Allosphingosinicella sp.]|nr:helix-turn-helix domain-containing protein [Allosphingosinicella sp.]